MPFITQGKTNTKYILIVVILAAIVGGGILAYQYWWLPKQEVKIPEIKPPTDETANWKTLESFTGSNGKLKYVLLEEKADKESGMNKATIYLSSSKTDIKNAIELIDLGFVQGIRDSGISKNEGVKYILIQIDAPAEGLDYPYVFDENGKEILADLSKFGLGTKIPGMYGLSSAKWKGTLAIFTIQAISANGYTYEGDFDATTGKQIGETRQVSSETKEEFCGTSTKGSCASSADCVTGGCSGQVCQSKNEEPVITTCEWTGCYDETQYGLSCKCVENKCQWSGEETAIKEEVLVGRFHIIWGDPPPDSSLPPKQIFNLTDDQGKDTEIKITSKTVFINGKSVLEYFMKRVKVTGKLDAESGIFEAISLEIIE